MYGRSQLAGAGARRGSHPAVLRSPAHSAVAAALALQKQWPAARLERLWALASLAPDSVVPALPPCSADCAADPGRRDRGSTGLGSNEPPDRSLRSLRTVFSPPSRPGRGATPNDPTGGVAPGPPTSEYAPVGSCRSTSLRSTTDTRLALPFRIPRVLTNVAWRMPTRCSERDCLCMASYPTSSAMRSSAVSRRRMRRAWPSSTSTTAGLYARL